MLYAFKQALKAIRNNWIASVSTITTMILSLMILAGFSLLSLNLNLLLSELKGELELAAYLEPRANSELLLREIAAWSEVTSASLIEPEAALKELVSDLSYLEQAASLVPNPLPPTIRIRLLDPSYTLLVSERLKQLPGVADVEDGSEAVSTFLAIRDAFRVLGSVLIIVLLTAALFAIVNSIRVAINARKDEIEVMRLVGATRNFIRAPFLIEGLILGLASALIGIILVILSYQIIINRLASKIPLIPFLRDPGMLTWISVLLLCLALLVGLIGSAISVSQYLEEEN
ncbi:MAG: permease-like cell division protein FtsX [Deinococcales bacterium]